MVVACFLLSALLLLASVHPFTTYLLSLAVIRRSRAKIVFSGSTIAPDLSCAICVSAYNEEKVIEAKALNLLELQSVLPAIEILVYIDGASDGTFEKLSRFSDQIKITNSSERLGKTHGMNQLVSQTRADIIIFTDANVTIDIASMANLQAYFKDTQVGCVCGHLRYLNSDDSATASVGNLYWKLEELTKRLETDCGGAIAAEGSFFAMRRSLHESPPVQLIDDFFLSMKVLIKGFRSVQARDIVVYERSASSAREEYKRKIRIGCQSFNVHRILWKEISRLDAFTLYKYLSHKLIRWVCGYLFIAAAVIFEVGLYLAEATLWVALLPVATVVCYCLGALLKVPPFSDVWNIFVSVMATGIGVWKSLRGRYFRPGSHQHQPVRSSPEEWSTSSSPATAWYPVVSV